MKRNNKLLTEGLTDKRILRDGQHNLGNNDRRKIGGSFNLRRGTERLTYQINLRRQSTHKSNQMKSNESRTDRHGQT